MRTTPRIISALSIAAALVTTAAQAGETGPYFRVDAGPVVVSDIDVTKFLGISVSGAKIQTKTGLGFSAAAGYKLTENVALELESGVQHVGFDKASIGSTSYTLTGRANVVPILANGILTTKLTETVSAHLGAGVGIAVTSADIGTLGVSTTSETKSSFMGQLKTGLDFKLSDNASAGIGYHLGIVDGPSFSTVKTDTILAHMFTASVGFKF